MDRTAIDDFGIAGYTLMERAGSAALSALRLRWPSNRALRIYCGLGNNAGDGYVVARLAQRSGLRVTLIACAPPEQLAGDAATAARDCAAAGVTPVPFSDSQSPQADEVIVDALFGTGLTRSLEGPFAAAAQQMTAAECPVLALDVPSGLDADTGLCEGAVVRAQCTIAFVGLKQGYFLGQGPDYCGAIEFAGLEIPPQVSAQTHPVMQRLGIADIRTALPRRPRTAHKGSNGRLLIVGGGPGMAGAVRMAGQAALRSGAGLVYLATHPQHAAFIAAQVPELIVHGVDAPAALAAAELQVDAIALGPGLGQTAWGESLCEWALAQPVPLVIDADGLNWLAREALSGGAVPAHARPWVLTPHPGEAARLLGRSVAQVQQDRRGAVHTLAERFDATVVLKGAATLICDGARISVCLAGNPGMASAGTGDVLTGILAGVRVQHHDSGAAARAAVLIHALAGDAVAAARGERGLLATDLCAEIQRWVNPN